MASKKRLILVTDDMLKAAAAWPYIEDEKDLDEWAYLSGLDIVKLRRLIPKLTTLNVIYPDGTLPEDIEKLISKKIDRQFGLAEGELEKEEEQEEEEEEDDE